MSAAAEGLPVSVQVRLARHARAIGIDPNLVPARFAVERFLYRLSCSRYAERLVLKGALLMLAWPGETIRPARDADLLGLWRSIGAIARANLHGCVQHRCRGGWASILAVVDSRRTDPAGGSLRRDPSGAIGQGPPPRASRCRNRRRRHA